MAPSPAARGTPKVGVAVSAGRGEAVLGFPVPARRSADSQRPVLVVWRRAVHATLYALNFVPVDSPDRQDGLLAVREGRV